MARNDILVMIPVSAELAGQLMTEGTLSGLLPVVSVNRGLIETFGIDPSTADGQEEAELAALQIAGVLGLRQHRRRLILTALVPTTQLRLDPDEPNGLANLDGLSLRQVAAVFAETEPPNPQLVAQIENLEIDDAWDAAQDFMTSSELLWHAPSELAGLLKTSTDR